jgi:outer membrane lipoprotein
MAAAFLVAGCTYPISEGLRKLAETSPDFAVIRAEPEAHKGSIVIWGGEVIETVPRKNESVLTVLQMPLRATGRPSQREESQGRFLVKVDRFLDPALYERGREITVGGEVVGAEQRPLGEIQYTYPVVKAIELHLWEERDGPSDAAPQVPSFPIPPYIHLSLFLLTPLAGARSIGGSNGRQVREEGRM